MDEVQATGHNFGRPIGEHVRHRCGAIVKLYRGNHFLAERGHRRVFRPRVALNREGRGEDIFVPFQFCRFSADIDGWSECV